MENRVYKILVQEITPSAAANRALFDPFETVGRPWENRQVLRGRGDASTPTANERGEKFAVRSDQFLDGFGGCPPRPCQASEQ